VSEEKAQHCLIAIKEHAAKVQERGEEIAVRAEPGHH